MNVAALIFLLHLACTLFLTGLIWFVQIVHYPLFAAVGSDQFCDYESRHVRLTTRVVLFPMLVELATALLLLWFRPAWFSLTWALIGSTTVLLICFSTFALQVPMHGMLKDHYDEATVRRLVSTNWIRTMLWSLRSVCLLTLIGSQC